MRNSLAVQWLGLYTFIAGGWGSIPGWGTKTQKLLGGEKKKKQQDCQFHLAPPPFPLPTPKH